jgi:6-pyruvoyltetrahydropterin/6-carboxytetrahydropterin synthase
MSNTPPAMQAILTREVRFGLEPEAKDSALGNASNGFAGNPALTGIAPYVLLRASLSGPIDPVTGMLINIKIVDRVLRQHAATFLRDAYYGAVAARPLAGDVLPTLFGMLKDQFSPHRLTCLTLAPSPFLSFAVDHKEPDVVRTSQRFEFSAAHRLHSAELSEKQNHDLFGRCNNPNGHGHNYEIEVSLVGKPDPATGQILPGGIHQLQQIVNEYVLDVFDHKHLNLDCAEFRDLNPTVENIVRVIYQKLRPAIPGPAKLLNIRVWETPKTMCEYSE